MVAAKYILVTLLLLACATLSVPESRTPEYRSPRGAQMSTDWPPKSESLLLSWPLKGSVMLSRGFLLGFRPHQGIDLAAPKGTAVRASHDGFVEYAGHDFNGYGKLVIINSGAKWATFYGHLNRIRVKERQVVRRGDRIGDVGETGNARGVHLHFELRHDQRPVDPIIYLP